MSKSAGNAFSSCIKGFGTVWIRITIVIYIVVFGWRAQYFHKKLSRDTDNSDIGN